ncbi:MAG: dihydrofolate reductase [Candidatus Pacebacteria bacterium]|nr:dihydrofolate reductase [Candidatus Paceibacterota bacterium]
MINIIAAIQSKDNGLGYHNDLLYKLPEDQKYFRDTTTGCVIIMGRKTWESIPKKFRPLPNRENIVITHDPDYVAPGAIVTHGLQDAISWAQHNFYDKEIFIVGGGEIYKQALPLTDRLYLTLIDGDKPADVFFPEYKDIFTNEKILQKKSPSSPTGLWYSISLFTRTHTDENLSQRDPH